MEQEIEHCALEDNKMLSGTLTTVMCGNEKCALDHPSDMFEGARYIGNGWNVLKRSRCESVKCETYSRIRAS